MASQNAWRPNYNSMPKLLPWSPASRWVIFVKLLALNPLLVLLGLLAWAVGTYQLAWPLIGTILWQLLWLYSLSSSLGLPVDRPARGELDIFRFNTLGWFLLVLGTLLTILIYFLIASMIARRVAQRSGTSIRRSVRG